MTRAFVYWFTGLSGSGKTTIAEGVKRRLEGAGKRILILDGDDVRAHLHRHLGFGADEVKENNALIAKLCARHRAEYDVIMVPIISPFAISRESARARLWPGFFEVYCKAEMSVLEGRDVKGLYRKARRGELNDLIGFSPGSVYEPPPAPDVVLETDRESAEEAIARLFGFICETSNCPADR